MRAPGCLPFCFFLLLLLVMPFLFAELATAALFKLGLSYDTAIMVLVAMFLGSVVNIPIDKFEHSPGQTELLSARFYRFGPEIVPFETTSPQYTILAVNVGGCVIPCLLAAYEIWRIALSGVPDAMVALVVVTGATIAVCQRLARAIPGLGIALPVFVPPAVAVLGSLLFAPEFAPPVAFTAGTLGSLIGADLLHLKDIKKVGAPVAAIGGAGTFDGIVLSGLIAALFA